jgi:S1-C subfamily serine protease
VAAHNDLAAAEQTTFELFEKARDSVVSISTAPVVRDAWTRNIFTVPRETGSGFVWDDAGHVVTNVHVIEGLVGFWGLRAIDSLRPPPYHDVCRGGGFASRRLGRQ